jgi:hypothetical protein
LADGKELWVDLYRMAMMELGNAKLGGRIGDARTEIAARLEQLGKMPGLHTVEKHALDDALIALRTLEHTDQLTFADESLIAEKALQSLRMIAPRFNEPD